MSNGSCWLSSVSFERRLCGLCHYFTRSGTRIRDPRQAGKSPTHFLRKGKTDGGPGANDEHGAVILEPDDILVLVNKERALPADYEPDDLVYPDIRFLSVKMR